MSGIVAGKTFGVSPRSNLVAVKVLDDDGYGTFASVIAGLEWVVAEATSRGKVGKSVVNMSLSE